MSATILIATLAACSSSTGPDHQQVDAGASDPVPTAEGSAITDLRVKSVDGSTVTLAFTQVADASGSPADYEIRYQKDRLTDWDSALPVVDGTCEGSLIGTKVGDPYACTVENLSLGVTYELQAVAFRSNQSSTVDGESKRVTVATPPPNGDPSGEHPNEPVGYTAATETAFDTLEEDGWYVSGSAYRAIDNSAPWSPSSVGRMEVPEGARSGGSTPGAHGRTLSSAVGEAYIHFWLKLDPNFWTQPEKCLTKIFFLTGPAGGGGDPGFASVRGCGVSDPQRFQINIQNSDSGVSARNLSGNVRDGLFSLGDWHEFEIIYRANTSGNSDGEVHVWIDGVKHFEYTDAKFFGSGQDHTWNNFRWVLNWGLPDGSGIAPHTYGMEYDHVYISGR